MRPALAMMLASLIASAPLLGVLPDAADDRTGMCEAFDGVAFTFCVAICEARICDARAPDDQRCALLARGFARVTGGDTAPCTSTTRQSGRSARHL